MKKALIITTAVIFILFSLSGLLLALYNNDAHLSLCITLGTVLYHFAMRIIVGGAVNAVRHNRFDYKAARFRQRPFEVRLYSFLRVKRWKKHMPTFDATCFDLRLHTPQQVAGAMCQAETVHIIIAVLSFVPVAAITLFGQPAVFVLTSAAAAAADMCFVIMQRYNRPRLLRLAGKGE